MKGNYGRRPRRPLSYGRPEATTPRSASERLAGRGRFPVRPCSGGPIDRARTGEPLLTGTASAADGGNTGGWRETWERLKEGDRARTWLRRQLRNPSVRKPVVGLAMAGAAAPLVRAGEPVVEGERGDAASAARQGDTGSAEETAEWLAATEREREREDAVQGAVERYGIDELLASDIHDIALEEGIDPSIAYGLVKTESSFQPRAVSHVGARGLTQLMPRTARWMAPEIRSNEQIFERETNLRVGFRYLRYLLDKYQGDTQLALLAYNRGPGTVDKVLSRGGNPDNGYAGKVLRGGD